MWLSVLLVSLSGLGFRRVTWEVPLSTTFWKK